MKKNLDVLLRINDSKISVNNTITTRIQEHMKLLNEKDSVIWGQSTSGKRKIAKSKVQIINQNIRDRGYIFVFFVSKKKIVLVEMCLLVNAQQFMKKMTLTSKVQK